MLPAFAGQIPVCMRCRNRGIRQPSIGDGLWPGGGEGIAWVCDACGHIGQPLLLDPAGQAAPAEDEAWEEEYEHAARGLEREPRTTRDERERARRARSQRMLGVAFLVSAGLFLLPPMALFADSLRVPHWSYLPASTAVVLGQTWLFIAIGAALLVLGVRKMDAAAALDPRSEPDRDPASWP